MAPVAPPPKPYGMGGSIKVEDLGAAVTQLLKSSGLVDALQNGRYSAPASLPQSNPGARAPQPYQQYNQAPAPNPGRPYVVNVPQPPSDCWYCQKPGHFSRECPEVAADLDAKYIKKHPVSNVLQFPDGRIIPTNPRPMRQQVQDWHKKFKSAGGSANLLQTNAYDPMDLPGGLTIYMLGSLDYEEVLESLAPQYDRYDPAQVYNLDAPPVPPPVQTSYTLLTRDREACLLEELAQLRRLRNSHNARVDEILSERDSEQFVVGTRRNPVPPDDEDPMPIPATHGRTAP